MEEIHKHGAKMFVQLTAGFGRSFTISPAMEKLYTNRFLRLLSKPIMNFDKICASSSPSPNRWSDKVPSREMTIKEIHKFVKAFAKTAKLLKDVRVDGVEIHAVHEGYLLDQFTLQYVNKRTDEYGGSFENRYRFPVEIVKALKEAEAYPGPSLVIAYAPCINHGIDMSNPQAIIKEAVDCGYWQLYRYNPSLAEEGKNPFTLDSKKPTGDYQEFLRKETRYTSLLKTMPEVAEKLFAKTEEDSKERLAKYENLAKND